MLPWEAGVDEPADADDCVGTSDCVVDGVAEFVGVDDALQIKIINK